MLLKISSPEKTIYEGSINKITLPTESGNITVMPNHIPLVSVVKPWLVHIEPEKGFDTESTQYILEGNKVTLSVSKGIVFIDGKNINIVTAAATISPEQSHDVLNSMKASLEQEIKTLKEKGSIEEIEKSLIKLEKINADLQLSRIKEIA